MKPEKAEGMEQRMDPMESLAKVSVLYVEDEETVRSELAELLEMDVAVLYRAENGREGLELFLRHRPDLVITDIKMPKMDGLAMAARIREVSPETPIIVTTAFSDAGYMQRAIEVGVDAYVTKPVEVDKLLAIAAKQANTLLGKRRVVELQSRHAAMGEMIGAIAHQWKQPLNALGLLLQDMGESYEYGEMTSAYVEESVETGLAQVEYMAQTISDFRNFFMPDKEKIRFAPAKAVEEVLRLTGKQYAGQGLRISVEGAVEAEAFGYFNEFKHVVINLFNNARDAYRGRTGDEKPVTVVIGREKDHVTVTITDRAGGIPSMVLERLFEPYLSTKGEQGTGIGLHMCKTIMENMGGSIRGENLDGGARLTLTLPGEGAR